MEPVRKEDKIKALMALLIFVVITIFVGIGIYRNNARAALIEKDSVYVIGRVVKISKGRKDRRTCDYIIVYKGQAYDVSISDRTEVDDERFLRISTADPTIGWRVTEDSKPCDCYSFKNSPDEGWKEIPVCREMAVNKYSFLFPLVRSNLFKSGL